MFWGQGVGAPGTRGRRSLLQHRDDRLSGDPDRSLLCRADHHLHLSAYRQCRRQSRGHRDRRRRRRAASCIRADITEPSNWRATQPLDAWLKSHGIVGHRRRRHAAADAAHPRRGRAQRASSPMRRTASLDIAALRTRRAAWPGLEGMDLAQGGHLPPELRMGRDGVAARARLRQARATPRFHVVAVDYGAKRNILRMLAEHGCRVTVVPATASGRGHPAPPARRHLPVERAGRSGRDRRLCGAGAARADRRAASRSSASASAISCWRWRSAARPRKMDDRPSRRQPSGQGPGHRQGRDHQPEPRLRRRSREPAGGRRRDARLAVRRHATKGLRLTGQPVFSVQYHPEASPGPQDSHYLFERFIDAMAARQ